MVQRGRARDSGLALCEDDHVGGHGHERCEKGVRVLEGSDRDGNDRYGCGRDVNDRDEHGRDEIDRDGHGHDENDHGVDGRLHAGDLHWNDLNGHVRRASAHAHDVRGRRRSCQ